MRRGDRFALLWPCCVSPLSLTMVPWRAYVLTLLRANVLTHRSAPPRPGAPCSAPGGGGQCGVQRPQGCLSVGAVSPRPHVTRRRAVRVCVSETADAVNELRPNRPCGNRAAVVARCPQWLPRPWLEGVQIAPGFPGVWRARPCLPAASGRSPCRTSVAGRVSARLRFAVFLL